MNLRWPQRTTVGPLVNAGFNVVMLTAGISVFRVGAFGSRFAHLAGGGVLENTEALEWLTWDSGAHGVLDVLSLIWIRGVEEILSDFRDKI